MTATLAADWPTCRDLAETCRVSTTYVRALIHRGDLAAVQTQLGWFIEPASATAFLARRAARSAQKQQKRKRGA
jgi:hypothetical protein